MNDLTKNFSRSEFKCRGENCCGGSSPISDRLTFILQEIRDVVGVSMNPTCGYRCLVHNREIGSKDTSQHPLGMAADFPAPDGYSLDRFYDVCCRVLNSNMENGGGCCIYPDRGIVHIDVRGDTCWRGRIDN